jgi:CYTH domain-containing protein
MAEGRLYRQGYLSLQHQSIVRVRVANNKGYITVKGAVSGIEKKEYEYEIPVTDANEMIDTLCNKPIIEKYRYTLLYKGFTWEIDEFMGENEGLVLAEIELQRPDQKFKIPDWIGEEVTSDMRYYNSNLVNHPYSKWNTV